MQGQSVIVTGGASGIGKATALLLARAGARVFVGDVDEAGGQAVAAEAAAERLTIEYLPLDLTDPSSIADFGAAVHQRADRVDGLGRSDEMLQMLLTGLQRRNGEAVLAFYGDHLPSLPHAFRHFGFEEVGSDYVVWRAGETATHQLDLPAHRLPRVVIDALHATGGIEAQGGPALVSAR